MRGAEPLSLAAGSSVLIEDDARSWRTNWSIHVLVIGTAGIGLVLAPEISTLLLAVAWVLAYAAGHWAHVMHRLPGAGTATVIVSSVLALSLFWVSGQGTHLFAAFPLVWLFMQTFRRGLVATIVFTAGFVAVLILEDPDTTGAQMAGFAAVGVAIAVFSIAMAAWFGQVENLAHARRELAADLQSTVSELEAARADLAASEHRRGVEEEGARIAAEIHDTLAQSFTSITMLVQAARQAGTITAAMIDPIEDLARDGLVEARALIAQSQAPLDLSASVRRLAEDLGARTEVAVDVRTDGWTAASTRAEVVLLRTVQEALRNIERHAGATTVSVRLDRRAGTARLEVADDGAGFDPGLPTAGFGLSGMRSRLEAEGGALDVVAGRGAGTILRASLPLEPDPAVAAGAADTGGGRGADTAADHEVHRDA